MQVSLPYWTASVDLEVPEQNLLFVAEPRRAPAVAFLDAALEESLVSPFGSPSLGDLLAARHAEGTVAVIVDDLTRPTPVGRLLPPLLAYLERHGVGANAVTLVVALGTHRPMSPGELEKRFGGEVVACYRVVQSDTTRPRDYVDLGATARGTPVHVHRTVHEAGFRIGLGSISPHVMAGWTGGAKIIQPGVCGEATTNATHVLGVMHTTILKLAANVNSVVRREIEEIAARVGLDFIVNTIVDPEGRVLGVFSGGFVEAHRAGVKLANDVFRPAIPALADVVVSSAYPTDRDYWQGFKAFGYAHFGIRPGGTVVFALAAPEGLSGNAPRHAATLRRWANAAEVDIREAIASGGIDDVNAASLCLGQAQLRAVADTICVSQGLSDEDAAALGFARAPDLSSALSAALARHGPDSKVGVIPFGGETVVRIPYGGGTAAHLGRCPEGGRGSWRSPG